jgi:hypothetical protein
MRALPLFPIVTHQKSSYVHGPLLDISKQRCITAQATLSVSDAELSCVTFQGNRLFFPAFVRPRGALTSLTFGSKYISSHPFGGHTSMHLSDMLTFGTISLANGKRPFFAGRLIVLPL